MKELIERCYNVELETREQGDAGVIRGVPIVYDSVTDLGYFDEVIERGALDKTNLTDVRLCLNHDTSFVYARSRNNRPDSTMRLALTDRGLEVEADLAINESPKARDYYSAVKRGDIDKMSFMFSVDEERWEDLDSEHPTRHILSIGSVVEVSAVTFPAYDSTSIQARSKEALDSARSALERVRQQTAEAVETDSQEEARGELELAKAKFTFRSRL
jgi:HK97 family phage prohead protease